MAAAGGLVLAHIEFPVYFIKMVSNRHFVVGGGGGESKTGVQNFVEVLELFNETGEALRAKELCRHSTGDLAPMNCAVAIDNAKNVTLACGQGGMCYLYRLAQKIVTPRKAEEGTLSLRKRKSGLTKSEEFRNAAKVVSFDFQPLDKVQTDFSEDGGFQKCSVFSKNCTVLVTAGADGYVRLWKLPEMKKSWEEHVHCDEIDGLDIDPEGNKIATVSRDGKVGLWNAADGSAVADLAWSAPSLSSSTTPVRYNPKGCRFGFIGKWPDSACLYTTHVPAVRSRQAHSSYIVVWDVSSSGGTFRKAVPTGPGILSSLDVSNDGAYLAVGTLDGSVAVFHCKTLKKVYSLHDAHKTFVTGVAFTSNSEETRRLTGNDEFTLLSISVDNQIKAHQRQSTGSRAMRLLVLVCAAVVATLFILLFLMWGAL